MPAFWIAAISVRESCSSSALVYTSPYRRTRETLSAIYDGCELAPPTTPRGIYEDPRLREVEHGYEPKESQEELRKTHGLFYYRFRGGESPADCFDRTSSFLESMMRQVERKTLESSQFTSRSWGVSGLMLRPPEV